MSRSVWASLRVSRGDRSSWSEAENPTLGSRRGDKSLMELALANEFRCSLKSGLTRGADPTAWGVGSPEEPSLPRRYSLLYRSVSSARLRASHSRHGNLAPALGVVPSKRPRRATRESCKQHQQPKRRTIPQTPRPKSASRTWD